MYLLIFNDFRNNYITGFIYKFAGAEGTPDSINPSVVDEEEGLPSPPLDEGAFFATQPTSMELSQVYLLCFSLFASTLWESDLLLVMVFFN